MYSANVAVEADEAMDEWVHSDKHCKISEMFFVQATAHVPLQFPSSNFRKSNHILVHIYTAI